MYCEMFTTIRLVNASIISHNYPFVVFIMERALKLYSHSNFQVYNIVLLTVLAMLYIRSPELTLLITESLYPLPTSPHCPSPSPWQPPFYFMFLSLMFLDSTYKWDHIVFVFLCLTYFTQHNADRERQILYDLTYMICLSLSDLFHSA